MRKQRIWRGQFGARREEGSQGLGEGGRQGPGEAWRRTDYTHKAQMCEETRNTLVAESRVSGQSQSRAGNRCAGQGGRSRHGGAWGGAPRRRVWSNMDFK